MGETGVGKTSLLLRFHEDQFVVNQKTTIGVDYKAKEVQINNEPIKLQVIWNNFWGRQYDLIHSFCPFRYGILPVRSGFGR